MGLLVVKADFVGKYAIAQNNFSQIDAYILKYEEKYLIQLLGAELFALFKADLANPTQAAIYASIQDPFSLDDTDTYCNTIRVSEGMKEMLLGFIFFMYIREQKYKNTIVGTVVGQGENSRETTCDENYLYGRYNESIGTYKAIQWYILKEKTDSIYETFNGQNKTVAHWSI